MGMYTELYLSCELKKDLPEEVVSILKYLFTEEGVEPPALPDHTFFKCNRWEMIGNCSSYYFVPFAMSKLYQDEHDDKQYYLITRSDLKNYDGEIGHFINWIMPYVVRPWSGHLGHYIYEEDENPTLIFHPEK